MTKGMRMVNRIRILCHLVPIVVLLSVGLAFSTVAMAQTASKKKGGGQKGEKAKTKKSVAVSFADYFTEFIGDIFYLVIIFSFHHDPDNRFGARWSYQDPTLGA